MSIIQSIVQSRVQVLYLPSGKWSDEVGVSGGGAPTLLRTSQLPFVGARLV